MLSQEEIERINRIEARHDSFHREGKPCTDCDVVFLLNLARRNMQIVTTGSSDFKITQRFVDELKAIS